MKLQRADWVEILAGDLGSDVWLQWQCEQIQHSTMASVARLWTMQNDWFHFSAAILKNLRHSIKLQTDRQTHTHTHTHTHRLTDWSTDPPTDRQTDRYFINHNKNKKLNYRRGTARCVVSVEILPIATQQCRKCLYDKSWTKYQLSLIDPCDKIVL